MAPVQPSLYRGECVVTLRMVTANRLSDGAVVYLDKERGWIRDVNQGIAVAEDAADALLREADVSVRDCIVVVPYVIAVEPDAKGFRPIRFREQIRAFGPTVVSVS